MTLKQYAPMARDPVGQQQHANSVYKVSQTYEVSLNDGIQSLHSKASQFFYQPNFEENSCSDSAGSALSQYFSRKKPRSSSFPEYHQNP